MNFDGAPCTNHPGFLQPAEQTGWASNPETVAAIQLCHTCPFQLPCLTQALDAGNLNAIPGDCDEHTQAPNGIIAGGIICDGTDDTWHRLNDAIRRLNPVTPIRRVRTPRPSHCVDPECGKPMVGNTETPIPGQVRHEARGLCINCGARHRYRNQHRKAA
jgi:hypothetical protein